MIDGSSAVDSVGARTTRLDPWRVAAPAAIVAVVVVLAFYQETVGFTVSYWGRIGTYSHGFLLLPISLFLIWQNRRRLARISPRVQPLGLVALAGLSLLWALAHFVDVQLVMQLSLLLIVAAVLWSLLGSRVFRELAFPVGYLVLGIPVWSLLTPTLQSNTAVAATEMLQAMGVPVFLDGYYMNIPSGQFVVEEVCSGLRYLMATLAIATLYAYLNLRRLSLGVVFVALAVVLAVVFNWLRVMIIVYIGYVTEMHHPLIRDHIAFGWIMFAVGLVPLFVLGHWCQRIEGPAPAAGGTQGPPGTVTTGQTRRVLVATAITLALVAVGPAAAFWMAGPSGPVRQVELEAPVPGGAWTGPVSLPGDWRPHFVGTSGELLVGYGKAGVEVGLYVAYYARQSQDRELVNETNALYDGERWKLRGSRDHVLRLAGGEELRVRELELVSAGGDVRLLWYWYQMGEHRVTSRYAAKLIQLLDAVTGTSRGAAVAVSLRAGDAMAGGRAALDDFLIAMTPLVDATLAKAGES